MRSTFVAWLCVVVGLAGGAPLSNSGSNSNSTNATCRKTQVAILGAGTAGITAAQALSNASVTDFLIVEYNADIGGRVAHTTFGKKPNGSPYTIELGANWVQGIQTPPGPVNPIWTLAELYNLVNTYSDYSSIETFTEKGAVDFTDLINDYETAYSTVEQDAGYIQTQNRADKSMRAELSLAGWTPNKDPKAQAAEWWEFDFEYAYPPDLSSEEFAIINYNTTFYQYSEANNYVFDERGFNAFIKGEASTFLKPGDSRLLLNTVVSQIQYSNKGVTVYNNNGSCITADYAICTFSLGVLQNKAVTFTPVLPAWKQTGIDTFDMGVYIKIFLQFDTAFWNTSTQFFLYADPDQRGYYPVWQSLDGPGFLPGSGIIFVTVVNDQAHQVQAQSDATTKQQAMAVLRRMFPTANVPAEPRAFFYPRWSSEPWAYGSYSNWPAGTSIEQHQNLRANVDRLYFAGEATSSDYFGFLHGAYFEGQKVGVKLAACLSGRKDQCVDERHYVNPGPTMGPREYDETNGFDVTSFQTYGF